MPTIRDQLQPVLRGLAPEFFDSPTVEEHKATCDRCVMCAPPGVARSSTRDFFRDDIKCCTYYPSLPNFLVGAILADDSAELAEGRARIVERIAARTGVTPRWLAPSRKYKVLLRGAYHNCFGRAESLRCPYYQIEGGRCTIWRHRNSHCATFYCKLDQAGDGQVFWRGLGSYWSLLETRVATLVMARVSADVVEPEGAPERLSIEELEDRPPNPAEYRRWWGPYEGREEEFYRACLARAGELGPNDAAALLGDDTARRRLAIVSGAYQQLHAPRFPARLKVNPKLATVPGDADAKLCIGYSRYEPLAVPDIIFRLLGRFDGEATAAEVQARIHDEEGADFADGLVLTLYQHRILVAADEPAAAPEEEPR